MRSDLTYLEELMVLEREIAIDMIKEEAIHAKLRAEMVEKHGEEWVKEVENSG